MQQRALLRRPSRPSSVHQLRRLPFSSNLPALIVEAVRQLVADHRPDAAVVDGGVTPGLIERRLQNAGGEVDAVAIGL